MKHAVITGASKGLGKAFAKELASRGYDILLIARSEDLLRQIEKELGSQANVKVHILALDLSNPLAVNKIMEWCGEADFSPSILINNAGFTCWGYFDALSLSKQQEMLQVIINSTISLTHQLLPLLKKNNAAYILNVCSTSAYQAVPTMSVYSASKAFIRLFSRGLRYELKNSNVSVTCFSPGPMATHFIEEANMQALQATAQKFEMDPEVVARIGIKNMFRRKKEVIPGWLNQLSVVLTKLVPDSLLERIAGDIYITKL